MHGWQVSHPELLAPALRATSSGVFAAASRTFCHTVQMLMSLVWRTGHRSWFPIMLSKGFISLYCLLSNTVPPCFSEEFLLGSRFYC